MGAQSRAAAIRFQKDNALDADGVFGDLTAAKSMEIIKTIQKEITDGKLAIDGLAGMETKDATVQWQRENGLSPEGIAGAMTRQKLLKLNVPEGEDWWSEIRFFSRREFACKCGQYCDGYPARMRRDIVEVADRARAELGGVSDSRHLVGKAVDLRIEGKSARQTLAWAQKQPQVRYAYAIDASYVHMDIE